MPKLKGTGLRAQLKDIAHETFLHFSEHRSVGRTERRVQQKRNLCSLPYSHHGGTFLRPQPALSSLLLQLHRGQAPTQSLVDTHCLGTGHLEEMKGCGAASSSSSLPALALPAKQRVLHLHLLK